MAIQSFKYPSPIGNLVLETSGDKIVQIKFNGRFKRDESAEYRDPFFLEIKEQLDGYFSGTLKTFNLPTAPEGTPFQQNVWKALTDIPYGITVSYRQLAEQLGNSDAVRAVGRANGQNPVPIVIPCHRVIGADNKLVGYGGGIERKRWLLKHEGTLLL